MGLRFTLAEDEDDYALLLERAVSRAFPDSSLQRFPDAESALQSILADGTDLLITDQRMGHMTGVDLIRELRAHGVAIPILMLSGNLHYEVLAKAAGVTQFLSKELPFDAIVAAIRLRVG